MMSEHSPLAIIAGAGSGLGQAIAHRFKTGGYTVVGLGRSQPDNYTGHFRTVDLADPEAAPHAINEIIAQHGTPKVVVHNTAELVIAPLEKTSLEDYQRTWSSMVQSAVLLAQTTLPLMAANDGGSFLVSGATASLRGGAKFSAFASAKFALRGFTQSLAREYQTSGIHVCHTILDGIIDTVRSRDLHSLSPDRMMKPADIAEIYWQVAHQPRSTWTQELDLRPASESF